MILGLIPARSGSKRIKNKNIYELNGKPLIQYTIEAAKNSKLLDDVIVSTDSKRIAEIANNFNINAMLLRPHWKNDSKIESFNSWNLFLEDFSMPENSIVI